MLHSMDPTIAYIIVMTALLVPPAIGGCIMYCLKTDYKGWDSFGKTIVNLFLWTTFIISCTITTTTIFWIEDCFYLRDEVSLGMKFILISLLQFIGWLISLRNND